MGRVAWAARLFPILGPLSWQCHFGTQSGRLCTLDTFFSYAGDSMER